MSWRKIPADGKIDHKGMIIYARPQEKGKWWVGLAYETVLGDWRTDSFKLLKGSGATHWMPMPDPPTGKEV